MSPCACSYGDDDDDDDDIAGGLPPPRLFCDICDVFDEHDTDDCPLQAASDSPPHSMHHSKRTPGGSDRPYCDNCEGKEGETDISHTCILCYVQLIGSLPQCLAI